MYIPAYISMYFNSHYTSVNEDVLHTNIILFIYFHTSNKIIAAGFFLIYIFTHFSTFTVYIFLSTFFFIYLKRCIYYFSNFVMEKYETLSWNNCGMCIPLSTHFHKHTRIYTVKDKYFSTIHKRFSLIKFSAVSISPFSTDKLWANSFLRSSEFYKIK